MRNHSHFHTHSRLWLALLVSCCTLSSSVALAIDNGACCVQSTSRLESLLNPNKGSDESFFGGSSGPPNVMFLLDTSCSMEAWPQDWPTSVGCNHATFPGNGYDPNIDYPSFISGMTGPPGNKTPTYDSRWFDNGRVYLATGDANVQPFGHHFGTGMGSGPQGTNYTGATLSIAMDNACAVATGSWTASAANQAACKVCLQTKGYYVKDSNVRVATGNYLEYYSPRDVAAVLTLSHLLFDVREIRLGIMTFGNWGGPCYDSSSSPICLWQELGPSCNQLYPLDTSAVENQRNSILNALSGNNPFSTWTPLTRMLYLAGYHLRSTVPSVGVDGYDALFAGAFPGNTSLNEPVAAVQHAICSGCTFNAAIILTDGEPNTEFGAGVLPPEITGLTTVTNPYCPVSTWPCTSYLDEVAAFLWNNDLRPELPGTQKMATYTIGFATGAGANQLLASTATVGGGKFYPASGASSLKQALLDILDDISSRNNSFASAAVASVQTNSSSTPAVLPRMMPQSGAPWLGRLWRFDQFNEWVEGTDLNTDGDQEDVFLVENTGGGFPQTPTVTNIVAEQSDGTFVRRGTTTPATPFWEANARLVSRMSGGVANRRVWTVFDSNGDGAFTDAQYPPVAGKDSLVRIELGTPAEDLRMAEYMGLRGSAFCPSASDTGSILNRLKMSLATAATVTGVAVPTNQAERDALCARLVILWVLGADLLDADSDANYTEVRADVLGDIFHSSPIIVGPPVDPFLCDLALSNQCVRTLYSLEQKATPTPQTSVTSGLSSSACGPPPASLGPYEGYAWNQRQRESLVLVGANDGMVHAFRNGSFISETCVGGQPVPAFNAGNGDEVWAFLPPDLLPKLADQVLGHQYMVDGDIMVRDVWADGSGSSLSVDGNKDWDEFHTLAVVSEGRGGKHYFALGLEYDTAGVSLNRPSFRWMFPQPCSEESATFGKTFFALSPKPPPIGPVLIDASSVSNSLGTAVTRNGVSTYERWIVALSGGWSPGLEKGRGIYLVDAWEGVVNSRRDNLWWKFEFDSATSPQSQLTHSVSGPVSLVDYGTNAKPEQDGFFDTAVFGDTQGQIWVARLSAPGTYSAGTGRISNWAGGRAFEMDRDNRSGSKRITENRSPFFYLPSVAIEPGTDRMRVFAGTGNRYAILEDGAGSCRFDNPVACSKSRCSNTKIQYQYADGVVNDVMTMEWGDRTFDGGTLSKTVLQTPPFSAATMCGNPGTTRVVANNADYRVEQCDLSSGVDPIPGQVSQIRYDCGLDPTGVSFQCLKNGSSQVIYTDLLDSTRVYTSPLGNNRFFGFWAYGDGKTFTETVSASITTYDSLRVSDRSADAGGGLTDVSNVGCLAGGVCDGGANANGNGWYLNYPTLPQKTATGSAVLASCVLWSDLAPSGGDGGTCSMGVTPLTRIYQADFLTGQPSCAFGFLDGGVYARAMARTVVAPPPEPASVVQVSKTGQLRYSAMLVEPGAGQALNVNVAGGQDVLQFVYEVPINRALHECRHNDGGCVAIP